MKKITIICGIPRSGTTALARLVSLNQNIVIGIERYKTVFRSKSFNAEFFQKEKFFDKKFLPTNVDQYRYQNFDELESRFESCLWVGDKIPNAVFQIPQIFQKFNGNIHFVIILRDPYSVAASWKARATNKLDSWPARNGVSQCAIAYENLLKIARENRNIFSQCEIVDYDKLFEMSDKFLAKKLGEIFQHELEFQTDEILPQIKKILDQHQKLSHQRKLLPEIDKAEFDRGFSHENWAELRVTIGAI